MCLGIIAAAAAAAAVGNCCSDDRRHHCRRDEMRGCHGPFEPTMTVYRDSCFVREEERRRRY